MAKKAGDWGNLSTGVIFQEPRAACAVVRRGRRPAFLEGAGLDVGPFSPKQVVALVNALRETTSGTRGPVRIVLPGDLCENYLHTITATANQGTGSVLADTRRWLEEEYGVEMDQVDLKVCRYPSGGTLAVAVSLTDVGILSRCQQALTDAGLYDVTLTSMLDAMIATMRATSARGGEVNRAVINVGLRETHMLLVRGDTPVSYRSVSLALSSMGMQDDRYEAFSRGHGAARRPDADSILALVEEFKRTLQAFQLGPGGEDFVLEDILLAGTAVDTQSMVGEFEQAVGFTTNVMPMFETLGLPEMEESAEDLRNDWPLYAVPAGIALPAKLPPEACLVATQSRTVELLTSKALAIGVAAIYIVLLAALFLSASVKLQEHRARASELQSEQQNLQKQLTLRLETYRLREQYREATEVLMRMKLQGIHAANMLSVANNERPAAISFENVTVKTNSAPFRAEISGLFENVTAQEALHALEAYRERLGRSGQFDRIVLAKPLLREKIVNTDTGEFREREIPTPGESRRGDAPSSDTGAPAKNERAFLGFRLHANSPVRWQNQGGE